MQGAGARSSAYAKATADRQESGVPPSPRLRRTGRDQGRDPFDAVPVRSDNAETREDRNACGQIRMRQCTGPGLMSRLAHRFGFYRDVRVNLDAHGSFYWSLVDGRRDLREIEQRIRAKFNLNADESRKATLMFTKMLMMRHVLHLNLGARHDENSTAAIEGNEHAE